jgi:hypothetical protein
MSSVFENEFEYSAEEWHSIDEACDRFERKLLQRENVQIAEFLEPFEERLRPKLLRQLLLLKWEYVREDGTLIDVREYRSLFPGYEATVDSAFDEFSSESRRSPRSALPPVDGQQVGEQSSELVESLNAKYEVLRQLASGAMATVLLARDRGSQQLLVIKAFRLEPSLSQKAFSRFCAEMDTLNRLQHPNIVTTYDHSVQSSAPYYTMEYCRGGSLADRLRTAHLSARRSGSSSRKVSAGD